MMRPTVHLQLRLPTYPLKYNDGVIPSNVKQQGHYRNALLLKCLNILISLEHSNVVLFLSHSQHFRETALKQLTANCHCHCGAVVVNFELDVPLEEKALLVCNCRYSPFRCCWTSRLSNFTLESHLGSICTKNGCLNVYTPEHMVTIKDDQSLLRVSFFSRQTGSKDVYELLQAYSYNPHTRRHMFCSNCGSNVFILPNYKVPDDRGKIGINVRSLIESDS